MRTELSRLRVTQSQLAMAAVLLVGVLVLAYGYFGQSKPGLYAGLVVIAGGVLFGVLQVITRSEE